MTRDDVINLINRKKLDMIRRSLREDGKPESKKNELIAKQMEQLRARKAAEDARLRRKANREQTRRKILLGAKALDDAERKGRVAELYLGMDSFLTRENDRALFGLPPVDAEIEIEDEEIQINTQVEKIEY